MIAYWPNISLNISRVVEPPRSTLVRVGAVEIDGAGKAEVGRDKRHFRQHHVLSDRLDVPKITIEVAIADSCAASVLLNPG